MAKGIVNHTKLGKLTGWYGNSWVPYTEEKGDVTVCGRPIMLKASEDWADKKVVLFAVPGMCPGGDHCSKVIH